MFIINFFSTGYALQIHEQESSDIHGVDELRSIYLYIINDQYIIEAWTFKHSAHHCRKGNQSKINCYRKGIQTSGTIHQ